LCADDTILSNIDIVARKLEAKSSLYERETFLPSVSKILWPATNIAAQVKHHAEDWQDRLELLLGNYAFSRKGGEGAGYQKHALDALRAVSKSSGGFAALATQPEPGKMVFEEFKAICGALPKRKGSNDNLNGVIAGLTDLAAKVRQSPVLWIRDKIAGAGRVEPVFVELLNIRGIGEKLASFILRDIVWLYELERGIEKGDLLYLQPVDIWVRRIASIFWRDSRLESDKVPRLLVARRLAEFCHTHGISGVRFNQGAWYFSRQEDRRILAERLRALVHES
jgi:hypothetical protein